MSNIFLKIGYHAYDNLEKKNQFLFRNVIRRLLIIYFIFVSFCHKNSRFNIYLRIGTLYLNLKNMTKAKEFYDMSNKLAVSDDEKVMVLMRLGNLMQSTASYEQAILNYERALIIAKFKTTLLSNLAYTYELTGEYEKALKYAEDSVKYGKLERKLGHTISPENNVADLIERLNKKLPRSSR